MGAAHTYGSGAELRMAAKEVIEVLREAGLGPNAERLLTTTAAGENHVLFVGTQTGTDIERRLAEAMVRVKRIDGAWLLEKAAQLVREKDCASRFGHNGTTRIDLGSLLRQAWRDLGGDLCSWPSRAHRAAGEPVRTIVRPLPSARTPGLNMSSVFTQKSHANVLWCDIRAARGVVEAPSGHLVAPIERLSPARNGPPARRGGCPWPRAC